VPVPRYLDLFNPTLAAIHRLGGSARIDELDEEVTKNLDLSEQEVAEPHDDRTTELAYQLAWARSYLKAYGVLDNSQRGVWSVTAKGNSIKAVNPSTVVAFVRNQSRAQRKNKKNASQGTTGAPDSGDSTATPLVAPSADQPWQDDLMTILLGMKPAAFERLCQRILRESGFVEVKVTGRSGDGGIDGVGLVRLGGLLSFPVLFQCKRYKGSVDASTVRDFRGAMVGRADRGLVMTTGTFTRFAKEEASRNGAPPIDLVDGEQLLDKLKELRLGVEVEMIEKVSVQSLWFQGI
jgi:restriction system protein